MAQDVARHLRDVRGHYLSCQMLSSTRGPRDGASWSCRVCWAPGGPRIRIPGGMRHRGLLLRPGLTFLAPLPEWDAPSPGCAACSVGPDLPPPWAQGQACGSIWASVSPSAEGDDPLHTGLLACQGQERGSTWKGVEFHVRGMERECPLGAWVRAQCGGIPGVGLSNTGYRSPALSS